MAKEHNEAGETCPVDHKTREAWLQKSRAAQSLPIPSQQRTPSQPVIQYYHPESGRVRHPLSKALSGGYISNRKSPSSSSSSSSTKLSTDREISSIPRAFPTSNDSSSSSSIPQPSHSNAAADPTTPSQTSRAANNEQETGTSASGHWIYPSEHQFYEAIKRKQKNTSSSSSSPSLSSSGARATDMHAIIPIHNAVNERAWAEILQWETATKKCGCEAGPKLASFSGLSEQLTPRARWNTWVLGYQRPFDRHDWVVDRCGTRVDYVIDFYEGKNEQVQGKPLNFYLDVRPKLNTWEGCRMRIQRALGFL